MKKILINKNNVEDYIEKDKFVIRKNFIVSPLVLDELDRKNIETIYEGELNNKDKTLYKVESILKDEYNIVDKSVIANVKAEVINILK